MIRQNEIAPGATGTTEDGHMFRIFITDGGGAYPVIGIYLPHNSGAWLTARWTAKGEPVYGSSGLRISEEPTRGVFWINIYQKDYPKDRFSAGHLTREEADRHSRSSRLACVKIEWAEGQGLEEDDV